jgi:AcrR family transcriptional regulator
MDFGVIWRTKQALGFGPINGGSTTSGETRTYHVMANLKVLIEEGQVTDPASPRGKLLDCAARLFRQKGYERTTVRDIASAVGIQSGSIFHHFPTKEDILRAVMTEALVYFTELLRDAVDRAEGTEAELLACIRSELQFTIGTDTNAVMSVLITEWRCLSEQHQQSILEQRDRYEAVWMDVLERAQTEGFVDGDVFILRRMLAGGIHWSTTWFKADGEMSIEDLAAETLRIFGARAESQ